MVTYKRLDLQCTCISWFYKIFIFLVKTCDTVYNKNTGAPFQKYNCHITYHIYLQRDHWKRSAHGIQQLYSFLFRRENRGTEKERDCPRNTWQVRVIRLWTTSRSPDFRREAFCSIYHPHTSLCRDGWTIIWKDRQMNKLAIWQCILNPSVMRHKIRRGYKEMYVLVEKLIESKCSNRIC